MTSCRRRVHGPGGATGLRTPLLAGAGDTDRFRVPIPFMLVYHRRRTWAHGGESRPGRKGGRLAYSGAHQRISAARVRLRDWTLTILLAMQVFVIFGMGPLYSFGVPISHGIMGSVLVVLIFVVIVAAPSLWPMLAVIAALVFDAASAVLVRLPEVTMQTYWMNAVGTVLAISGVSGVVVTLVFSPGPIDRHRIIGAVVLYLNFALLFGGLFRALFEITPNAFAGLPSGVSVREAAADLMYFSMATLTTVGYGDIVPVHPVARSLAQMDGLIGQLYPAIILARVMGMYRGSGG